METNSNGMMDTSNQPDIKPDISRLNVSASQGHGFMPPSITQPSAFPAAAYASLTAGGAYYGMPGKLLSIHSYHSPNRACIIIFPFQAQFLLQCRGSDTDLCRVRPSVRATCPRLLSATP